MYSTAVLDRLLWVKRSEIKNEKFLLGLLTVIPRPFSIGDTVDLPEPIYLFEYRGEWLGIARAFGLKRVPRHLVEDKTSLGWGVDKESYAFNSELNEHQQKAVESVMKELEANYGAILSAPTGSGKTVMAINIITRLKLKTLVVVHKSFLKDQWLEAFRKFAPTLKVGEWQQENNDVDSADVVVALIQTIVSRAAEVPNDAFGFIVFDEVHHLGAPIFSQVAKIYTARYRLGLSATPTRKDGAENVFKWHIGDVVEFPSLEVLKPAIKRVVTSHVIVPSRGISKYEESFDYALRFIVKNTERNKLIAKLAADAVDAGRQVLILTHRRSHVKTLHKFIVEEAKARNKFYSVGYAMGGEEVQGLENKNIIIGTYQFISEGFDIKSLDTLIMATPIVDPVQSVGRILRVYKKKNPPIVVDLIDQNVPIALRFFQKRWRVYGARGWLLDVEKIKEYNERILSRYFPFEEKVEN